MDDKKKVIRVAAMSDSLRVLLNGQLRYLNSEFEVIGVGSNEEKSKQLAEVEGIRTITLQIERSISPIQDIKSLFNLYRLFKKEKPFIVHSITPKAGLLSMMAAFMAGVPNRFHTFTGLVFPTSKGLLKQLLIFFDKVICFCATKLYPEGNGVKNDLINYGITKKPLKVIAHGNVNGINLSLFDPNLYSDAANTKLKNELGILKDDFVFVFVGRLVNDKGIKELVCSFVAVQEKDPNVKLLIVGSHTKFQDALPESIKNDLESNNSIIQVGWQNDVRPFFAISDIFVFPSYREGFPNTVLQAGAMGKFSIVTDINGSNEIIEDGSNGKIIPPKDAHALETAMLACLQNKEKYKSYNPAYRKIIAEKYEQHIVWTALLEEYQSLT